MVAGIEFKFSHHIIMPKTYGLNDGKTLIFDFPSSVLLPQKKDLTQALTTAGVKGATIVTAPSRHRLLLNLKIPEKIQLLSQKNNTIRYAFSNAFLQSLYPLLKISELKDKKRS